MYQFISGSIMVSCLVAGFFFFRFWKKTSDSLFMMFSFAFWILAIERLVLGYIGTQHEPQPQIYLIRLTAFLLILSAIVRKNRNA